MSGGVYSPVVDDDPGWINRRLQELQRQIDERNAERRLVPITGWQQAQTSDVTPSTGFTEYARTSVTVPAGYNTAILMLTCTARARVAGMAADVVNAGELTIYGEAVGFVGISASNGRSGGGPVGVSVSTAFRRAGLSPGPLEIWAKVSGIGTGSGFTAGSGVVNLSAVATFTRE